MTSVSEVTVSIYNIYIIISLLFLVFVVFLLVADPTVETDTFVRVQSAKIDWSTDLRFGTRTRADTRAPLFVCASRPRNSFEQPACASFRSTACPPIVL